MWLVDWITSLISKLINRSWRFSNCKEFVHTILKLWVIRDHLLICRHISIIHLHILGVSSLRSSILVNRSWWLTDSEKFMNTLLKFWVIQYLVGWLLLSLRCLVISFLINRSWRLSYSEEFIQIILKVRIIFNRWSLTIVRWPISRNRRISVCIILLIIIGIRSLLVIHDPLTFVILFENISHLVRWLLLLILIWVLVRLKMSGVS